MERLIKNNDIILDGTKTRYQKEKDAFIKLGKLEEVLDQFEIKDIKELERILNDFNNCCQDLINIMGLVAALRTFISNKGLDHESKIFVKKYLFDLEKDIGNEFKQESN